MLLRLAAIALLIATAGAAYAQLNRCGFGPCPNGTASSGLSAPSGGGGGGGGTNFILMIDNTSRILQTDNASKICKAGGC